MYVVILAGGGGTRLHPLSRPERPKPFLPLLGRHSLLQLTVARLMDGDELNLRPEDIAVVTHQSYVRHVEDQRRQPIGRFSASPAPISEIITHSSVR